MKYTHGTIYQTIKGGKTEETFVFFNLLFDKVGMVNNIKEFLETAKEEGLRLYAEETVYEEDGTVQRTYNYKRPGMISGAVR